MRFRDSGTSRTLRSSICFCGSLGRWNHVCESKSYGRVLLNSGGVSVDIYSPQPNAPRAAPCETLARRDDGAALGGRRGARSGEGVPPGARMSRYARAGRCPPGTRRAVRTRGVVRDGCVVVNQAPGPTCASRIPNSLAESRIEAPLRGAWRLASWRHRSGPRPGHAPDSSLPGSVNCDHRTPIRRRARPETLRRQGGLVPDA